MDSGSRFTRRLNLLAAWSERVLAVAIFVGVVVFGLASVQVMLGVDWRQPEAFYDLIYRILLAVIGLELVRTLLTHDLEAVLELLAFVVARKTLKPDLAVTDIFLSVVAFCLLFVVRHVVRSREAANRAPRGLAAGEDERPAGSDDGTEGAGGSGGTGPGPA